MKTMELKDLSAFVKYVLRMPSKTGFIFLFICGRYTHLRKTYMKRMYYIRPNRQRFVYLLQSESRKTLLNLAKYIKYALEVWNALKNPMITYISNHYQQIFLSFSYYFL